MALTPVPGEQARQNASAVPESARVALEPWLIAAALARFNEPISPADQRTIVKAARTPHRTVW